MHVPTCYMHVEFKDNLGEFLVSSTVVPEFSLPHCQTKTESFAKLLPDVFTEHLIQG